MEQESGPGTSSASQRLLCCFDQSCVSPLKIQIPAYSWILLFRLFWRSLPCPHNCWDWTDWIWIGNPYIGGWLLDEFYSHGFDRVAHIFPCKQSHEVSQNNTRNNFYTGFLKNLRTLSLILGSVDISRFDAVYWWTGQHCDHGQLVWTKEQGLHFWQLDLPPIRGEHCGSCNCISSASM